MMGYQIGLARISDDQSEGNDIIETLRHPPKGSSGRTYSEYDVAHEVADLEFVKGRRIRIVLGTESIMRNRSQRNRAAIIGTFSARRIIGRSTGR